MSSEVFQPFNEISLKDATQFIVDNRGRTAPTSESGIALIATNCVNNNDLYPTKKNLRFVSEDTYQTWFRAHPQPGDILLTNKGSQNGAVCLVPDPVDFCIAQDMVALRADPKKISPLYLFAALRSTLIQQRIKALNVDAVIPHLKKTDFDKLFIPLPECSMQKWIGEYYFEVSSRIELLQKTNGTLEAIAQALFKSWFIDFDPVRAKAEGRQPEGMDSVTAALFPDSFEEFEQGIAPKGWGFGELGEILSLRNERTQPSEVTKKLPYVPIESIGSKSPFLSGYKLGDEANSSLTLFKRGDILFGAMRPYFHKVCIAPFDGVTRTTVFTLFSKNKKASEFALFLAYQESTIEYATQHSEGSTIPYAKWKNSLERMPISLPPAAVQEKFSEMVSSLISRADANNQQAHTLTKLRDTLLPRLISGQLQIRKETQIEEACV